jgi:hypothetical protein
LVAKNTEEFSSSLFQDIVLALPLSNGTSNEKSESVKPKYQLSFEPGASDFLTILTSISVLNYRKTTPTLFAIHLCKHKII